MTTIRRVPTYRNRCREHRIAIPLCSNCTSTTLCAAHTQTATACIACRDGVVKPTPKVGTDTLQHMLDQFKKITKQPTRSRTYCRKHAITFSKCKYRKCEATKICKRHRALMQDCAACRL